jgi:DDE domain
VATGRSWYVDETYIKVHGHWRYLYRAIDRSGALVDVMFSEHRDMAAAKCGEGHGNNRCGKEVPQSLRNDHYGW